MRAVSEAAARSRPATGDSGWRLQEFARRGGNLEVDQSHVQAGRRQRSAAGASNAKVARVRNEVDVGGKAVAAKGRAENLVAFHTGRNPCCRRGVSSNLKNQTLLSGRSWMKEGADAW
jgi:hypothetical protein